MRSPVRFRNKDKYCHYHKDVGHDTNDCNNLKRLLDKLAEKGMLNSYVLKSKVTYKRADNGNGKGKEKVDSYATDEGVVAMISSGFASGGPTVRGTKESIRGLKQVMHTEQIKGESFPSITICESNRGKVRTPHDDPMVVELKVANMKVRRILMDTGSSSDIISLSCLKNL